MNISTRSSRFFGVILLAALSACDTKPAPASESATYAGGRLPSLVDFAGVWRSVGEFTRAKFGDYFLVFVFAGLWLGAASHTFTDMAGSFINTGRIAKFL